MIVKTPGSQMGSPAAAEGGGEARGGGRGERGERNGMQARSTLESTAPKESTSILRYQRSIIDCTNVRKDFFISFLDIFRSSVRASVRA